VHEEAALAGVQREDLELDRLLLGDLLGIVQAGQIGRASCRERVS
jgi:hypothetical protein